MDEYIKYYGKTKVGSYMRQSGFHSIWLTVVQTLFMQCYYSALNPIGVANCIYKYSKFEFYIYETCTLGCGKVLIEGFFLFRL